MIALQINSTKKFMSQLLASDSFDIFLLEEAVISTMNTFTIDGHINRDFYLNKEANSDVLSPDSNLTLYDFRPWGEIKNLCFDLMKGKRTPLFFRFVLQLSPEKTATLLAKELPDFDYAQLKAFILNIRYDGTKVVLTTGTSFHTFVLSKEPDLIWDKAITKFLTHKELDFEIL